MKTTAFIATIAMTILLAGVVSAQQKPTTGYASVNGLKMYYEILKASKAPTFFIHGDADGVRLDHISEMFSLKGGGISGDLGTRSASRLAILPDTTHVTLMNRMGIIVPMVNDFLDAKPSKQ
jgi:hypothetical protein